MKQEIKKIYNTAAELGYLKQYLDQIKAAETVEEAERILKAARKDGRTEYNNRLAKS